jgi:hypothetical protein
MVNETNRKNLFARPAFSLGEMKSMQSLEHKSPSTKFLPLGNDKFNLLHE